MAVLLKLETEGHGKRAYMGDAMDEIRGSSTRTASDATGEVTARVTSGATPTVELGPMTKSHLGAHECAITILRLVNTSVAALWSDSVAERSISRQLACTMRFSAGGTLTIDQRLEHINSALDTARSKAASVRTGQTAMPMRSAGRKDRVWIEEMDGFLTQVLIDDAYFATAPIAGIASEVTRCLADLGDVSATPPRLPFNDGAEGRPIHG